MCVDTQDAPSPPNTRGPHSGLKRLVGAGFKPALGEVRGAPREARVHGVQAGEFADSGQ